MDLKRVFHGNDRETPPFLDVGNYHIFKGVCAHHNEVWEPACHACRIPLNSTYWVFLFKWWQLFFKPVKHVLFKQNSINYSLCPTMNLKF